MKRAKTGKRRSSKSGSPKGMSISAGRDVDIGGDVTNGDKIVNAGESRSPQGHERAKNPFPSVDTGVRSAWANGLFYLFAFVVVVGVVGWLAGNLPILTLAVVIIAGAVFVPLVGAFQLRMDKRLSDKSFAELLNLVFRQLPLISNLIKPKTP